MTDFKRTRNACYFTNVIMASIFTLPPLLFVTFRETYGISYTLLGTLVLINFTTQLLIDLIFTFFTKYFNIKITLRVMPLLTSIGMFIYAFVPMMFPDYAYAGLVVGTVVFSVSAGLSEVLISPVVAAIPSDNPDRDMSRLHSLYAYGVVIVVIVSTLFLRVFGVGVVLRTGVGIGVGVDITGVGVGVGGGSGVLGTGGQGSDHGQGQDQSKNLLHCLGFSFRFWEDTLLWTQSNQNSSHDFLFFKKIFYHHK